MIKKIAKRKIVIVTIAAPILGNILFMFIFYTS
mgnify:CR=1 FL=1|jgi:hypothetical protein